MKQKTKRIIAKEGLIILSLILLAGLSFYMASSLNNKKYEYTSNAQEVEIAKMGKSFKVTDTRTGKKHNITFEKPPTDEDLKEAIDSISPNQQASLQKEWDSALIPQGVIVLFPKETSKSVIEKTIRRDFSYIDNVDFITYNKPQYKNIDRYYDTEGNRKFDSFIYKIDFFIVAIFLFVGAYPSYLLIRFIVWAIKTLKNRTGENE